MSGSFKKFLGWLLGGLGSDIQCSEEKVKEVIEEVLKEIDLKRKVQSVEYRHKHHWYIVRFYSPPSCIIPRQYLEQYIKTKGRSSKKEIIDILSTKNKGFELI